MRAAAGSGKPLQQTFQGGYVWQLQSRRLALLVNAMRSGLRLVKVLAKPVAAERLADIGRGMWCPFLI